MKHFLAVLIAAFTFLVLGQASAATSSFADKSIDNLSSPLICAEEEKKKKKKKEGEEDEEPECD